MVPNDQHDQLGRRQSDLESKEGDRAVEEAEKGGGGGSEAYGSPYPLQMGPATLTCYGAQQPMGIF